MVPDQEVRSALERILSSDYFVNAMRQSAFLRFVVERTIAADGAQLKEYLLGVEVFGRGQDFDPRLDPVVRVEARRLRAKLQEYYDGPGRTETIRIVLRKGGYAPTFERVEQNTLPVAPPVRGFRWVWIALALFAVAGAGTLALRESLARQISIVVIPSAEEVESAMFADGLGQALAGELSRNSTLRVIAWPKFAEYRNSNAWANVPIDKTASVLGAETVLAVNVGQRGGKWRVFAVFMRVGATNKEWFEEYEREPGDEFAIQRELARFIAQGLKKKLGG